MRRRQPHLQRRIKKGKALRCSLQHGNIIIRITDRRRFRYAVMSFDALQGSAFGNAVSYDIDISYILECPYFSAAPRIDLFSHSGGRFRCPHMERHTVNGHARKTVKGVDMLLHRISGGKGINTSGGMNDTECIRFIPFIDLPQSFRTYLAGGDKLTVSVENQSAARQNIEIKRNISGGMAYLPQGPPRTDSEKISCRLKAANFFSILDTATAFFRPEIQGIIKVAGKGNGVLHPFRFILSSSAPLAEEKGK